MTNIGPEREVEGRLTGPTDDIFYVFANTVDVLCWANLRHTRQIISSGFAAATASVEFRELYLHGKANYAPFVPNQNLSTGFRSQFSNSVSALYNVEYDAEFVRYHHFPKSPSRLSAVFAFGSLEDCQKASEFYNWNLNSILRFRLIQDAPITRVQRANMEIISLMRGVHSRAIWCEEQRSNIWKHYWSGRGTFSVEIPVIERDEPARRKVTRDEIWEYLVEGRLELID